MMQRVGTFRRITLTVAMTCLAWLGFPATGQIQELVPSNPSLSMTAERAISSGFLTDEERREKRLFHGVWTDADLQSVAERTMVARLRWDLDAAVWLDESVPAVDRAENHVRRGAMSAAVDLLSQIEHPSPREARVLAEALEWLGRFNDADTVIHALLLRLSTDGMPDDAHARTEIAKARVIQARLRGEPSQHFNRIMEELADVHQRIDRSYWPAKLVEAEVLLDKDNRMDAVIALQEVISLNLRCSEAWFMLGQIAMTSFDFDSAELAASQLRSIHDDHPLATLLETETLIHQGFPDAAESVLESLLDQYPHNRHAFALQATIEAIRFDEDGMFNLLDAFDEISPDNPWAYYTVGTRLSRRRQYELSATLLEEAIRRQPNWPPPYVELGLMEMQSGRDGRALDALRRACQLDPFNTRASFSLHLIEDLMEYEILESEHFEVRFDPQSQDRALAREMLEPLERIHTDIAAAFQHEPSVKTRIELLPNHERFGVRITGMPQIHTIAAATGPVIAMEAPRQGAGHFGTYDWQRTLRHEYVHTITLSRTRNRIPHWFTEAAAVWQEPGPRKFDTCVMLANAWRNGRLFDLDEINWAFVRPKQPSDRSQAYAQGHWMFEFMIERYGHAAMLDLLDEYRDGFTEEMAMPSALGVSRTEFYDAFLDWAADEVAAWGMDPDPSFDELLEQIRDTDPDVLADAHEQARRIAAWMNAQVRRMMTIPPDPEDEEERADGRLFDRIPEIRWKDPRARPADIERWLDEYPNHPDLLVTWIEYQRDENAMSEELMGLIDRYIAARPVDPRPHRWLAMHFLDTNDPSRAIPHLEELDSRDEYSGAFAIELARQYRSIADYRSSLRKAERALAIDPYNASYRELAAAIAIQARDLERARHHLVALTILEPDRDRHRQRLDALDNLMERDG